MQRSEIRNCVIWLRDLSRIVLRFMRATTLDQALARLSDVPAPARPAFLPLAVVGRMLAQLATLDAVAPPSPSRLGVLWTTWRASGAETFKG